MVETWRGIYPITSFVLEALGRKREAGREDALSEPEQLLFQVVEFWAAAAHGTLDDYLAPDPTQKLLVALHAFEGIGAIRVASLLRVAVGNLGRHDGATAEQIVAQLDESLARTDDNVDDLVAQYAGKIDDPASHVARP